MALTAALSLPLTALAGCGMSSLTSGLGGGMFGGSSGNSEVSTVSEAQLLDAAKSGDPSATGSTLVGDIDAATLGKVLDQVFSALPAKAELKDVPLATMHGTGRRIVVDLDVPQAVMALAGVGITIRREPSGCSISFPGSQSRE